MSPDDDPIIHVTDLIKVDKSDQASLDSVSIEVPIKSWELWSDELFTSEVVDLFAAIAIEEGGEFDLAKSLDLVRLIVDHDFSSVGKREDSIFSPDEILRIYTNLKEQNEEAAQLFFVNMRRNAIGMVKRNFGDQTTFDGGRNQAYFDRGEYFGVNDLYNATQDWGVPMAIHIPAGDGGHASLVLSKPERDGQDRWRMLVYDPMKGGEDWRFLSNYKEGMTSGDLVADNIYINPAALQSWDSGEYGYDIRRDRELADSPNEPTVAKRTRVQFDARNCVLACGFMALVRTGSKNNLAMKDMGTRSQVYKDVGVKVLLRDEILGKREPPSSEDLSSYTVGDDVVIS